MGGIAARIQPRFRAVTPSNLQANRYPRLHQAHPRQRVEPHRRDRQEAASRPCHLPTNGVRKTTERATGYGFYRETCPKRRVQSNGTVILAQCMRTECYSPIMLLEHEVAHRSEVSSSEDSLVPKLFRCLCGRLELAGSECGSLQGSHAGV